MSNLVFSCMTIALVWQDICDPGPMVMHRGNEGKIVKTVQISWTHDSQTPGQKKIRKMGQVSAFGLGRGSANPKPSTAFIVRNNIYVGLGDPKSADQGIDDPLRGKSQVVLLFFTWSWCRWLNNKVKRRYRKGAC